MSLNVDLEPDEIEITKLNYTMATGGILMILGRLVVLPAGIIIAAFLARQLGPADFGLYSVLLSLIVWARLMISVFFNRASIIMIAETKDWEPIAVSLIQLQFLFGLVCCIVAVIIAPALATNLGDSSLVPVIWIFALAIPISALAQSYENTLDARRSFARSAMFPVVYEFNRLFVTLILVGAGFGLIGAALGSLGAAIAELWYALRSYRLRLWSRVKMPEKRFIRYSLPLSLDALAKKLHKRVDLWAVQIFTGATSAGYYSAALSFNSVGNIFSSALARIILSTVSEYWSQGKKDAARPIIKQCLRLSLLLLPFAALGAGAATGLSTLIFGEEFLPAAPLLAWVSFSIVAFVIMSVTAATFAAVGRPGSAFAFNGPLLAMAILGYLILIPRIGVLGAAITTAVTAWAVALITLVLAYRWCEIDPGLSTIIRIFMTTVFAFIVTRFWQAPGLWLVIQLGLLSFVLMFLLFVLGEITRSDLIFVKSLFGRENINNTIRR